MPLAKSTKTHPNKTRKVPTLEKFGYGLGHVFNDMVTSFLLSFIAVYVTIGLRLHVTFAGYILFVILLTDALSRPVIIVLSRKLPLCCYFGRRKSWHLIGSIFLAISVVMTFTFLFEPEENDWPRFLVYVPIFIMLAITFTCAQVSHKAILREMTGLTAEKNLLSSWRTISSLIANMAVFVVAAIFLGVFGDTKTNVFTQNDASIFSYISYFILASGTVSCIIFYILVPEKTQTCREAITQCQGCCYRTQTTLPFGDTRTNELRRGSKMASLSVDTGYARKRSLSGGSGQLLSVDTSNSRKRSSSGGSGQLLSSGAGQSGNQSVSNSPLPPIKVTEEKSKPPQSLKKTGHLIINVQKLADTNTNRTKSDTAKTNKNGSNKTSDQTSKMDTNQLSTEKIQTNLRKTSGENSPRLDLQTSVSVVVNAKKLRENVKSKNTLQTRAGVKGNRTPSPMNKSRNDVSGNINPKKKTIFGCCLCLQRKVKDTNKTTSGSSTKESPSKTSRSQDKSRTCCWCLRRQRDEEQKTRRNYRSTNKKAKRDCCPWFQGMCKKPKFFKTVVIHACSKLAFIIAQVYMPLYLTESLAMSKISVAIVPLVIYISGFIATLVTRKINAKYGRKRTFAIGEACVLGASIWLFFIPIETNNQVYATVCLLGVGLSTLQVRSAAMMTDLTGSPVDSGAAVFGVNEKVIQAIAIVLLQVLSPCRLDSSSDDCKLFYRSIMLSMPGGTTFISFLVLSLAKVIGIEDEQQGVEVSDGNAIEISSSIAV